MNQNQKQLIEPENLQALGGLVAGVAHEINTPVGIALTGVTSLAEHLVDLQQQFNAQQLSAKKLDLSLVTMNKLADLITNNLFKTEELISKFKQIAVHQDCEEKRQFNVGEHIHNLLESMEKDLKTHNLNVTVRCDEHIFISSFPFQFTQIITNLILNTRHHAISDLGVGCTVTIHIELKDEHFLLIYEDSGKGIAPELLDRIMEPFFTTARSSGCSGLGMYIVYNIVKTNLRGEMSCQSRLGSGVRFTIKLRLTELTPFSSPNRVKNTEISSEA